MRLNENEIKLTGINISVILSLPSEDAGGQTSSTETIDKGIKPKLINVSGYILMKEAENLTELNKLVESLDEEGKRTKYQIIEPVAEAMNIREVRFFDRFSVKEDEAKRQWKIDFVLREVNSVAEAKEKAASAAASQSLGANGVVDISSEQASAQASIDKAAGANITDIEQFLKKADDLLGTAGEKLKELISE